MSDYPKEYLGDGVYASFDGYGIWIKTSNGAEATNEIYLEPNVYNALTKYRHTITRITDAERIRKATEGS